MVEPFVSSHSRTFNCESRANDCLRSPWQRKFAVCSPLLSEPRHPLAVAARQLRISMSVSISFARSIFSERMIMPSLDALKIGLALSLMSGLGVALQAAARADSGGSDPIDAALRDGAPRIMKYVKDHGYRTVGVLKFTVKKGDKDASLNAGPLNTKMATSLERALILLNDNNKPINIIHDANKFAVSQSRGATFRNSKGRYSLLEHAYPLAWDSDKKHADAFLTGQVHV